MRAPPVVLREMAVLASGKRFYWARMALAAFAVVACLQWLNFKQAALNPDQIGPETFRMLSWLGFVVALGAAIVTADCISYERREGTLGLLFLTTMKSREVVLGKLTVMGLVTFMALAAFAPVLMVPVLCGGLTGGEIVRVTLALLNIMFVSLTCGLFVSVFARSQFGAILVSFTLVGFVCLAPFFVQLIAQSTHISFVSASLVAPFMLARGADYLDAPMLFWLSLAISHGVGWILIGAAVLVLERNWRAVFKVERSSRVSPQTRRLVGAPRVLIVGRDDKRRVFAPVARAMLRMRGLSEMAWFAAAISLTGSILNAFVMNKLASVWGAACVSVIFTFASSSLFAFVGGRFLFDARRSGELELLVVTPVGAKGILREQKLALLRVLRGPLYLVTIGAIVVAVGGIREYQRTELIGLLIGLCHTANAILGILAVCWTGMWFANRTTSIFGLIGWTVGVVEVLPIVVSFTLPLLLFGMRGVYDYWQVIVPVMMVIKNVFFIRWARARLHAEFPTKTRRESVSVVDKIWAAFFGKPERGEATS